MFINMEKFDFIKLMLQNRNLSLNDKKRLLLLATREIEKEDNHIEVARQTHTAEDNINYISPKDLQLFLYRFNQDGILKYTCHEIDTIETKEEICNLCGTQGYSLRKHSEIISKAFEELNKKLRDEKIFKDPNMYALMSVYLTGSTPGGQTKWSSLKIETNWASPDLFAWGDSNPDLIPSPSKNIAIRQRNKGYELPKALRSNLTGSRILTFKELVLYFKSLFHIRRDNSLLDILNYINNTEKYSDKKINIVFLDKQFKNNIELLTNVDKLVQAYKRIIEICRNSHKDDDILNIELSFFEEEGFIYFCIHDKDSIYGKNLDAATKRIGEQHMKLIKNQINGLCDLYIEADFDNQEFARIALWDENSGPQSEDLNIEVIRIDHCQGVKYILRF